jgi:hypothetical protein
MVIRESVEPLLDDYKPPGIASLKFSKLSLGHVSPKIEGLFLYQRKFVYLFLYFSFLAPSYHAGCLFFCLLRMRAKHFPL